MRRAPLAACPLALRTWPSGAARETSRARARRGRDSRQLGACGGAVAICSDPTGTLPASVFGTRAVAGLEDAALATGGRGERGTLDCRLRRLAVFSLQGEAVPFSHAQGKVDNGVLLGDSRTSCAKTQKRLTALQLASDRKEPLFPKARRKPGAKLPVLAKPRELFTAREPSRALRLGRLPLDLWRAAASRRRAQGGTVTHAQGTSGRMPSCLADLTVRSGPRDFAGEGAAGTRLAPARRVWRCSGSSPDPTGGAR